MVVLRSDDSSYAAAKLCGKCRDRPQGGYHPGGDNPGRCPGYPLRIVLRRGRLRPAAPARSRAAGHAARARVAEICLFRAAARVRKGHAELCATAFLDFLAAAVADENQLTSHEYILLDRLLRREGSGKRM